MKIGSSPTEEGVERLLNSFFCSTSYKYKDGFVSNSKGVCENIKVEKKRGRFYIEIIT